MNDSRLAQPSRPRAQKKGRPLWSALVPEAGIEPARL